VAHFSASRPTTGSRSPRVVSGSAGLGVAWLLLLGGPIGWIGLLMLVAAAVLAYLLLHQPAPGLRILGLVLVVVATTALVRAVEESIRLHRYSIRATLDASRRWVTLSGVHPNFQAAVQSRLQAAQAGSDQRSN
jgi:hypothetical protein